MAQVNDGQVARVAAFLKASPPKTSGMNFYSIQTPEGELVLDAFYPPLNHPHAVHFFFFACLHQYGFWYGDDKGYVEPMIGNIGKKKLKGSDLLWGLCRRMMNSEFNWTNAFVLAHITPEQLATILVDDTATPWPNFEDRLQMTRAYGRWLGGRNLCPGSIVAFANQVKNPLERFLDLMSLPGNNPWLNDPLQKKQLLLAMILANRPEKFLQVVGGEDWHPIVDYHLMRVALRLGMVDLSADEMKTNVNRRWAPVVQEAVIRGETKAAVIGLIEQSGLPMATIDETLWMARRYCPEMTNPECDKCLLNSVCAKRTELFQPVLRTTAY